MSNESPNNKQKINKILLTSNIMLTILVIALVGYITLILKPKLTSTKPVAGNVTDIETLTEISTKIDQLLSNTSGSFQQSTTSYDPAYKYGLLKNKLTPAYKQQIVLDTVDWEEILEPIDDYNSHKQTLEKINQQSLNLFGEKIEVPEKTSGECKEYSYEQDSQTFYKAENNCLNVTTDIVKMYKSKFEKGHDEMHVYVSFAFLATTGTNSKLDTYTIYKDFSYSTDLNYGNIEYKDAYQTNLSEISARDFNLNLNNYESFSEYKFTFKETKSKDYYFVKVEQIK